MLCVTKKVSNFTSQPLSIHYSLSSADFKVLPHETYAQERFQVSLPSFPLPIATNVKDFLEDTLCARGLNFFLFKLSSQYCCNPVLGMQYCNVKFNPSVFSIK